MSGPCRHLSVSPGGSPMQSRTKALLQLSRLSLCACSFQGGSQGPVSSEAFPASRAHPGDPLSETWEGLPRPPRQPGKRAPMSYRRGRSEGPGGRSWDPRKGLGTLQASQPSSLHWHQAGSLVHPPPSLLGPHCPRRVPPPSLG